MKFLRYAVLTGAVAFGVLTPARSVNKPSIEHGSDREHLIGAWKLVRIDASGPDGQPAPIPQPKGMLIYTRDGHMSVQLMYPQQGAKVPSNEYVQDGYEASFGSYDVDEATHTVTHQIAVLWQCSSAEGYLTRKSISVDGGYVMRPEKSGSGDTHMEIKRNGSQPSAKGPSGWFTGSVRIDKLFEVPEPARVVGAAVTFEPGARTAWHTHPLGQTLLVTSGCGRAQRWGGPVEEIRPGDVIWFSPGEKHWHGATPATGMTHIAIQEKLDGKTVDWMEQVSDEQYRAPSS